MSSHSVTASSLNPALPGAVSGAAPVAPNRGPAGRRSGPQAHDAAGATPTDPAGFSSLLRQSQLAGMRHGMPATPAALDRPAPAAPPASAAPPANPAANTLPIVTRTAAAVAPNRTPGAPQAQAAPTQADVPPSAEPGTPPAAADDASAAAPAVDAAHAAPAERSGPSLAGAARSRTPGTASAPPPKPVAEKAAEIATDTDDLDDAAATGAATAPADAFLVQLFATVRPLETPSASGAPTALVVETDADVDDDVPGRTGVDDAFDNGFANGFASGFLASSALAASSAETPGRPAAPGVSAVDAEGADFARALAELGGPREAADTRPRSAVADRSFDATVTAAAANASAPLDAFASTIGGAPPVSVALSAPVETPDFAQELALRLGVFVQDGVQQAELHLNPAELGPVSVRIALDGTQARIDFGADATATRQAIQAGLPELASALRDAGFTLAGGGVSQHAGQRQPNPGSGRDAASTGGRTLAATAAVGEAATGEIARAARRIATRGGLDLFA